MHQFNSKISSMNVYYPDSLKHPGSVLASLVPRYKATSGCKLQVFHIEFTNRTGLKLEDVVRLLSSQYMYSVPFSCLC